MTDKGALVLSAPTPLLNNIVIPDLIGDPWPEPEVTA